MPAAPTSQFLIRVAAIDGDLGGPEVVEALALELRAELADAGAMRVNPVHPGGAPEGARGIEVLAVCSFLITAVQAGESLGKIVAAIRRVVARFAQRQQPVRVTVGGIDVDLAAADENAIQRIVRALLALPAQPAVGLRDALVVANAQYDDPELAQLRSPGHDAGALARVLGDPGIGGFNVELLLEADERTIRRRIAAFFADRDRDDLLLLHFSCHGIKDIRGRLHLAARDTDLSVLGATSVPASFVHDALDQTQSRRVVLILDCCYSGAFARGALVRSGNDVQIADEFGAGSGRIVLTASSATEYAFEGANLTQADGQPSVFTAALVDGLQTGAADLDADGEISIDELYDYTYRQVRERTPGQAPMKWSFGVEGSLVVARSIRPAALPESIVDDLASDRVVLRLEAVSALAQLLVAGKPGLRAAALAALAGVRDADDSVQVRRAATAALSAEITIDMPVPDDRGEAIARPRSDAGASVPPAPRQPAPPEPVSGPPARVAAAAPAAAAPTGRTEGRTTGPGASSSLFVTAGLLVLVSVLLYAVGVYGVANVSIADDWYHNVIWVVQLVAAGLLLATRHARWGGLLLGALAWSWVDLAAVLHSSAESYLQNAWGFLVTADLIALMAQVCIGVAVIRHRPDGFRVVPVRVFAAVLLAFLAVATSLLVSPLLYEVYSMDTAEGTGLRLVAAIVCGIVILVAVIGPLPDSAASFVPVGWWFGGAELGLTVSIDLSRDGIAEDNLKKVVVLWILLTLTAGAAIVAARLLGRHSRHDTPARPVGR